MYSMIELHNKPLMPYRYEICVLLLANAWELILKAHLYKNLKNKSVKKYLQASLKWDFMENEDEVEKIYLIDCINKTFTGRLEMSTKENLQLVNKMRNTITHAFILELEPLLFSIMAWSVRFYVEFIKTNFNLTIWGERDFILLPIGFNKPFNAVDFFNTVKEWLKTHPLITEVYKASKRLTDEWIDDAIMVNFQIETITANKVKNPDIVAAIDNTNGEITINREVQIQLSPTWNPTTLGLTRDKYLELFNINYKSLSWLVRAELWADFNTKDYGLYYRILKESNNHGSYWWRDPNDGKFWYSQAWKDFLVLRFNEHRNEL